MTVNKNFKSGGLKCGCDGNFNQYDNAFDEHCVGAQHLSLSIEDWMKGKTRFQNGGLKNKYEVLLSIRENSQLHSAPTFV